MMDGVRTLTLMMGPSFSFALAGPGVGLLQNQQPNEGRGESTV